MREAVATGPVARKLPRPLDGLLRRSYRDQQRPSSLGKHIKCIPCQGLGG
jgi:hypothetical protein